MCWVWHALGNIGVKIHSSSADTEIQRPGESFRIELDLRCVTFGLEIKAPCVDLIAQEEYEKWDDEGPNEESLGKDQSKRNSQESRRD